VIVEQTIKKKERMTLTDFMRVRLKGTLDAMGGYLNGLGVLPIQMTYLGLLGHAVGAFFLLQGAMTTGGLVILLLAPVDALDGTMARWRGEPGQWGAFVDSTVDRYSELFVFGAFIYYFASTGSVWGALLAFLAASGSVLVSYVRARAQALGFDIKVGILSRLERYLILIPSLVFNVPVYGMAIIAVGAHVTALQRIFAMRREVHRR
jgi:CDP-diacylglycerol--glycerol-3-phosphate 3-phosphatidyltransferase